MTARLKPGALLWESESAVSRIPYRMGPEVGRALGSGVKVEARFVGIEWPPGSNGMVRHH